MPGTNQTSAYQAYQANKTQPESAMPELAPKKVCIRCIILLNIIANCSYLLLDALLLSLTLLLNAQLGHCKTK